MDDNDKKNFTKDLILRELLEKVSDQIPVPKEKIGAKDVIMYVFTSGTTGKSTLLPKALQF